MVWDCAFAEPIAAFRDGGVHAYAQKGALAGAAWGKMHHGEHRPRLPERHGQSKEREDWQDVPWHSERSDIGGGKDLDVEPGGKKATTIERIPHLGKLELHSGGLALKPHPEEAQSR